MSSNSILALDKLPYDLVHQLATAGNALGARHVKPVGRWPWSHNKSLLTCDVCFRTWPHKDTPRHADYCVVGRTQQPAQAVIALGSQPFPKHLRITEVPTSAHERSEGRTGRRRADGDSSGTELAPRFGEPLAWNPRTRQIVDRFGHVAADLNRTDLTPEEQQIFGPRMVLCMNFFAGDPSEMIRNAMAVFAEAKAKIRSSPARREVYGPLVLDADETGTWYVQEGEGVRTSFHGPDGQVGARAFFTARKNLLRDEKQVGA